MRCPMNRSPAPASPDPDAVRFERISVRVPDACRLTGIGRSKFYQLVASGAAEVVKIGAMTLGPVAAPRGLIDRARRPRSRPRWDRA